jgi:hypothetical protein
LVKDVDRFRAYRDGVSDFVKWIEADALRFSKNNPAAADQGAQPADATQESLQEEDDCFSYDGGISAAYANTDLELFILKKILLEHKQRDDAGFYAKELSFNNDHLADICRPIHLMIEDKILYLSANTWPRAEENNGVGIEDKRGFINWDLVEKLDKNQSEIDAIGGIVFDVSMQDELKLKNRIDIAIDEFMNDRIQDAFGRMMDKANLDDILIHNEQEPDQKKKEWTKENFGSEVTYQYSKQRGIILDELARNNEGEMIVPLSDFHDKRVDMLKTLLALERENILRIKDLISNPMYDENGNFIGLWATKDNPSAKISMLRMPASIETKPMTKTGRKTPLASEKKSLVGEPPFATKPEFDEKKSKIVWSGQNCEIPINENSYYFCKKIFGPDFGEKVSELDISDQDEWDGGSPRSVYNAMNWVNGLIKDSYGIENNLFKSRKNYFWIRDELFGSP